MLIFVGDDGKAHTALTEPIHRFEQSGKDRRTAAEIGVIMIDENRDQLTHTTIGGWQHREWANLTDFRQSPWAASGSVEIHSRLNVKFESADVVSVVRPVVRPVRTRAAQEFHLE